MNGRYRCRDRILSPGGFSLTLIAASVVESNGSVEKLKCRYASLWNAMLGRSTFFALCVCKLAIWIWNGTEQGVNVFLEQVVTIAVDALNI